jgi:glyoxylase-like metal-dependent hydrolase (beta-lactamase superfamily II)
MAFEAITPKVFQVAGPEMTDPRDCCVYLADVGVPVLIDTGAGPSYHTIRRAIAETGLPWSDPHTIILTHCHIDHMGSALRFKQDCGARIVAHARDADAVEQGDPERTAAGWYGLDAPATPVDVRLTDTCTLEFPNGRLVCVHTPGHTPGSISVLFDTPEGLVLFGQDIHGPFSPIFGSSLSQWADSMRLLLGYNADILCEGHFGVIRPAGQVRRYIERYLEHHGY